MSSRSKRVKPRLEEFHSARQAPHKAIVSKLSKVFSGPKEAPQTKYESLNTALWRPNVIHQLDDLPDGVHKIRKEPTSEKKAASFKKLVGNSAKEKVKKYEKLPQGFDEERGFLEDYQYMDMNTLLDEDDEEDSGAWKWFVGALIFAFMTIAYLWRWWSQRETLDTITN